MKVQVGNTEEYVEVGQYREVNKSSLKAFFTLVEYPSTRKTLDCRYFKQGDKRWISFPQKEVKYSEGRPTEYIPYVSYVDKTKLELMKNAVLKALSEHEAKEPNGQTSAYKKQANPLQDDASSVWFG